jgi:hypothetical protein
VITSIGTTLEITMNRLATLLAFLGLSSAAGTALAQEAVPTPATTSRNDVAEVIDSLSGLNLGEDELIVVALGTVLLVGVFCWGTSRIIRSVRGEPAHFEAVATEIELLQERVASLERTMQEDRRHE